MARPAERLDAHGVDFFQGRRRVPARRGTGQGNGSSIHEAAAPSGETSTIMLRCPSCGCERLLVRVSDVLRDYRCLECHEAWKPSSSQGGREPWIWAARLPGCASPSGGLRRLCLGTADVGYTGLPGLRSDGVVAEFQLAHGHVRPYPPGCDPPSACRRLRLLDWLADRFLLVSQWVGVAGVIASIGDLIAGSPFPETLALYGRLGFTPSSPAAIE